MKNSGDEKKGNEAGADIRGRIEALDQNLRSVDTRLRAVEKRLSIKTSEPDSDLIIIDDDRKDSNGEFQELRKTIEDLGRSVDELESGGLKNLEIRVNNLQAEVSKLSNKIGFAKSPEIEGKVADAQAGLTKLQDKFREIEVHAAGISSVKAQVSDAEHRITKLENQNKITVGKIKVPIEFSGLVAAIVLLGTGYLISTDRWDIIRSSYYPITIGILFGAAVVVKFIMGNRE